MRGVAKTRHAPGFLPGALAAGIGCNSRGECPRSLPKFWELEQGPRRVPLTFLDKWLC